MGKKADKPSVRQIKNQGGFQTQGISVLPKHCSFALSYVRNCRLCFGEDNTFWECTSCFILSKLIGIKQPCGECSAVLLFPCPRFCPCWHRKRHTKVHLCVPPNTILFIAQPGICTKVQKLLHLAFKLMFLSSNQTMVKWGMSCAWTSLSTHSPPLSSMDGSDGFVWESRRIQGGQHWHILLTPMPPCQHSVSLATESSNLNTGSFFLSIV